MYYEMWNFLGHMVGFDFSTYDNAKEVSQFRCSNKTDRNQFLKQIKVIFSLSPTSSMKFDGMQQ